MAMASQVCDAPQLACADEDVLAAVAEEWREFIEDPVASRWAAPIEQSMQVAPDTHASLDDPAHFAYTTWSWRDYNTRSPGTPPVSYSASGAEGAGLRIDSHSRSVAPTQFGALLRRGAQHQLIAANASNEGARRGDCNSPTGTLGQAQNAWIRQLCVRDTWLPTSEQAFEQLGGNEVAALWSECAATMAGETLILPDAQMVLRPRTPAVGRSELDSNAGSALVPTDFNEADTHAEYMLKTQWPILLQSHADELLTADEEAEAPGSALQLPGVNGQSIQAPGMPTEARREPEEPTLVALVATSIESNQDRAKTRTHAQRSQTDNSFEDICGDGQSRTKDTEPWICDSCGLLEEFPRLLRSCLRQSRAHLYGHTRKCRIKLSKKHKVHKHSIQGVCRDPRCELQPHPRAGRHLRGADEDSCSTRAAIRQVERVRDSSWLEKGPEGHTVKCSARECKWTGWMGPLSKSLKTGELPEFHAHTEACTQKVVEEQGLSSRDSVARWCERAHCVLGCPQGHVVRDTEYMSRVDPLVCSQKRRARRKR